MCAARPDLPLKPAMQSLQPVRKGARSSHKPTRVGQHVLSAMRRLLLPWEFYLVLNPTSKTPHHSFSLQPCCPTPRLHA